MNVKIFLTCASLTLSFAYCGATSDCNYSPFFSTVVQVDPGKRLELRNADKLEQLVSDPSDDLNQFVQKAKQVHENSVNDFLRKYDVSLEPGYQNADALKGTAPSDSRFSAMECIYADKFSSLSVAQKKLLLLYLQCIKDSTISEMDDSSRCSDTSGDKLWRYISDLGDAAHVYLLKKHVCQDYINEKIFTNGKFNLEYVAKKLLSLESYSEEDADKIFAKLVINFTLKSPALIDVVHSCMEDMRGSYSTAVRYGWDIHSMSIPEAAFLEKLSGLYGKENFMESGRLFDAINIASYFSRFIVSPDACEPSNVAPLSTFDFNELREAVSSFKSGLREDEIIQVIEYVQQLSLDLREINRKGWTLEHAYPGFADDVVRDLSKYEAFDK